MTCWAGFSAWLTSSPRARSLTAATNSLTTGSATSASSSAMPDLARGGVDVGLGEPALAAEVLEGVGEPVGERGEQVWGSSALVGPGQLADGANPSRPVRAVRPSAGGRPSRQRLAYGVRRRRRPLARRAHRPGLLDVEDVDGLRARAWRRAPSAPRCPARPAPRRPGGSGRAGRRSAPRARSPGATRPGVRRRCGSSFTGVAPAQPRGGVDASVDDRLEPLAQHGWRRGRSRRRPRPRRRSRPAPRPGRPGRRPAAGRASRRRRRAARPGRRRPR